MPKDHGYAASRDQVLARLARIEGQVCGIARMVQEDRYCIYILTQISAIQAALDNVGIGLLSDHAHHCVMDAAPDKKPEMTQEMMNAIKRLLRRG